VLNKLLEIKQENFIKHAIQQNKAKELNLFITALRSQILWDQFCPTEWAHQGPFWPP
jgi:hypothetical protein